MRGIARPFDDPVLLGDIPLGVIRYQTLGSGDKKGGEGK